MSLIGRGIEICSYFSYIRINSKTGYPFLIIKDAGHNSNVDNSDEVNQRIKCFLERYGY